MKDCRFKNLTIKRLRRNVASWPCIGLVKTSPWIDRSLLTWFRLIQLEFSILFLNYFLKLPEVYYLSALDSSECKPNINSNGELNLWLNPHDYVMLPCHLWLSFQLYRQFSFHQVLCQFFAVRVHTMSPDFPSRNRNRCVYLFNAASSTVLKYLTKPSEDALQSLILLRGQCVDMQIALPKTSGCSRGHKWDQAPMLAPPTVVDSAPDKVLKFLSVGF